MSDKVRGLIRANVFLLNQTAPEGALCQSVQHTCATVAAWTVVASTR